MDRARRLDALCESHAKSGKFGDVLLALESRAGDGAYRFGDPARPFFIASATKLFTTALMARLRERGAVDWDQPFARFLPGLDVTNLARLGADDHTPHITVRQLLAHTSGLPDYFEGPRRGGPTTFARALDQDFAWTVEDVVRWGREEQRPHFAPGTGRKAHYSDTNYQLLGAIIEHAHGASFGEVVAREIAVPLGLDHTWCFGRGTLDRFGEVAPLQDGAARPVIPKVMASVGADGGVVSTLDDAIRFLRAFFGGALFEARSLQEMQATWRRIFFPLEYGTGIMRFRVPWYFSPFRRFPDVVGHSGASGTVMFFCPERDLFIAGTVNQLRRRSAPFQLMLRALSIW